MFEDTKRVIRSRKFEGQIIQWPRTDNTMAKRRTDNTIAKRRTDTTMAKRRTNNDLQNTTQKTKD